MKINYVTLALAVVVAILGVINDALAKGMIQVPPAEQWLVPIISAIIVMVTRHITDTGSNTLPPPPAA